MIDGMNILEIEIHFNRLYYLLYSASGSLIHILKESPKCGLKELFSKNFRLETGAAKIDLTLTSCSQNFTLQFDMKNQFIKIISFFCAVFFANLILTKRLPYSLTRLNKTFYLRTFDPEELSKIEMKSNVW